MRLLLDTHVFIWCVSGSPRLDRSSRQYLLQAEEVHVSAASIWEIAIKSRLKKIEGDPREFADAIRASGFTELPVTAAHAVAVADLPLHHTDPFDRLLLAQAFCEPLQFVTADRVLTAYGGGIRMI